jgi:hypothetical protein
MPLSSDQMDEWPNPQANLIKCIMQFRQLCHPFCPLTKIVLVKTLKQWANVLNTGSGHIGPLVVALGEDQLRAKLQKEGGLLKRVLILAYNYAYPCGQSSPIECGTDTKKINI